MAKHKIKYYKILANDGSACNGGIGKWHLPKNEKPGEWMPKITDPVPCKRGYHLCKEMDILSWLGEGGIDGTTIYEAEYRGKRIQSHHKIVVEEARLVKKLNWTKRTAHLFAKECQKRALNKYKTKLYIRKRDETIKDGACFCIIDILAMVEIKNHPIERKWIIERLMYYLYSDI